MGLMFTRPQQDPAMAMISHDTRAWGKPKQKLPSANSRANSYRHDKLSSRTAAARHSRRELLASVRLPIIKLIWRDQIAIWARV
jgi:hypothetical protein